MGSAGPPSSTEGAAPQGVQPSTGQPAGAVPGETPVINPEAVTKALKEYQTLQKKLKQPALTGAAGLFTDNVVFPQELLDPENPANDPKYLHLLLAIFGLKELKQFFATEEQKAEEEESDDEPTESTVGIPSQDKKKE